MAIFTSMPISVWLFTLCLGTSVALAGILVVQAIATPSPGVASAAEGPGREPAPPFWRLGWRLIERFAPACRRLAPSALQIRLAGQLREAGMELALSPAQFIAGRLLLAMLALLSGVLLVGPDSPVVLVMLAAMAWLLPGIRLGERVRQRRQRLRRDLPVALDLIGLGVQAGMTTSLAISLAIERGPPGPLRDEFARVMREVKAGRSRQEALRAMSERYAVPGLRHAIAAILTAEKQGADLSPVLQAQAGQRREERFLDAERRAMQAPVKLLLPLVLFIFPGTFAILMFPIVMQVIADGLLF